MEMLDRILDKLDELQTDILEIKHQTTKTNGRVTRLEEVNEKSEKKYDKYIFWLVGAVASAIAFMVWEYVKITLINK
jgi:hypothetical protein